MNAFIQALQAKSAAINQARVPVTPKPVPCLHTTPEIAKAFGLNKMPTSLVKQDVQAVTVNIVVDRNRLDIFFAIKPDSATLASLHAWAWHYRPSDKAWYHLDCEANRQYLRDTFNLDIDSKVDPVVDSNPLLGVDAVPTANVEVESSDRFEMFKRQVNELSEGLKLDPADLMLEAIACLHKATFTRN